MIPVTVSVKELDYQKVICDKIHADVEARTGVKISYLYGTMIEIPRAALLADEMASTAQFFSFGTKYSDWETSINITCAMISAMEMI